MLDFYLLGVARSGTSALTYALNLHRDIFCGIERFPLRIAPHSICFPDSFLDNSIAGNDLGKYHATRAISLLSRKQVSPQIIGDKLPRKIFAPSHLKGIKRICIYRSHEQVASSWGVRAADTEDLWDRNRTAFMSFLDLMIFFMTAFQDESAVVVDYDNFFWGNYRDELESTLRFLGANPTLYPSDKFEKIFFKATNQKHISYKDKRCLDFAQLIMLPDFEKQFAEIQVSERSHLARSYGLSIQKNISKYLDHFLELLHPAEFSSLFDTLKIIDISMSQHEAATFFPLRSLIHSKTNSSFNNKIFFKEIHKIYPDAYPVHIELSKIYNQQGDIKKAIQETRKAIKIENDSPHFYHHLGCLLKKSGELEAAKETQEKAVSLDVQLPGPHLQLREIYNQLGNTKQALFHAQKIFTIKLDRPNLRFNLKKILKYIGELEEGEKFLEKKFDIICLFSAWDYYHLGNLLLKNGELKLAQEAQEKALTLDTSIPEVHIQLSHIFNRLGNTTMAIQKAQDAIAIKDDNPNFYHHLGQLLMINGELEAAQQAQEKAIRLKPSTPGFHIQLSHIFNRLGNTTMAIQKAQDAIAIKDDNPNFYHHLEQLLRKNGELEMAQEMKKKALSLGS